MWCGTEDWDWWGAGIDQNYLAVHAWYCAEHLYQNTSALFGYGKIIVPEFAEDCAITHIVAELISDSPGVRPCLQYLSTK